MNLLYRGSENGFKAKDFHGLCNDKGATLTVLTTSTNRKFGGFTSLPWQSNTLFSCLDPTAFMFSLDLNEKYPPDGKGLGVFFYETLGPCFGAENDSELLIADNSNKNKNSFVYNKGFEVSDLPARKKQPFQVKEIEVFQVNFKQ